MFLFKRRKVNRFEYLISLKRAAVGTEPGTASIYMGGDDSLGFDESGEEQFLDFMSYRAFGYPLMPKNGKAPVLRAVSLDENLDNVKPLTPCTRSGAIITNRAKEIIESFDIPNIEFFPVDVVRGQEFKMSSVISNRPQPKPEWLGDKVGKMWYLNVFNWIDAIDLSKSDFDTKSIDVSPMSADQIKKTYRFGTDIFNPIRYIHLRAERMKQHLFLLEAPDHDIWSKVYISDELLAALNEDRTGDDQITIWKLYLGLTQRHAGNLPQIAPQKEKSKYYYYGKPETKRES